MEKTRTLSSQLVTQKLKPDTSVPHSWEEAIQYALDFFPELQNVRIRIKARKNLLHCQCRPGLLSFLQKPDKRTYQILISTTTVRELTPLLFENLSFNARVGMIAHALAHIIQFQQLSRWDLVKNFLSYPLPSFRKKWEKEADKKVVEHGLGWEFFDWANLLQKLETNNMAIRYLNHFHLDPDDVLFYIQNLNQQYNDPLIRSAFFNKN